MKLAVKIVKQCDGIKNKELVSERVGLFIENKIGKLVCPSCQNEGSFIANVQTTIADGQDYGDTAASIQSFVCDPCGTVFQPREVRGEYISLYRGRVRGELITWYPD